MREIRYVSSDVIKPQNISLEDFKDGDVKRTRVRYLYSNGEKKDLILTTPPNCYIKCLGVSEDRFNGKLNGRHSCSFVLENDGDEGFQMSFYNILSAIEEKIKNSKGKEVRSPTRVSEDEERLFIFTKLMEKGREEKIVLSKFYDKQKKVIQNPLLLERCMARPMLMFSFPDSGKDHINLKITVSQLLIDRMLESNNVGTLLDDSLNDQ
jgi:hypothetical protein